MGEANDLTQVLDAAALLPDVTFVLQGDGKRRAELEASAPRERALPRTGGGQGRRWPSWRRRRTAA